VLGLVTEEPQSPASAKEHIDAVAPVRRFPASAYGLMLAPLAPNPAVLLEHQRQGQTCVSAMVAISAAHWILQQ